MAIKKTPTRKSPSTESKEKALLILEVEYNNIMNELQSVAHKTEANNIILTSLDKTVDLLKQQVDSHVDSTREWQDRHEKYHIARSKEASKRNWALWIVVITTVLSAIGGSIVLLITQLGHK